LAQFKGTVFESTRSFTERTFGKAGVERVLERLSPAERDQLSHVQAMGWCSVDPVLKYHHALEHVHGIGDLSLCFEAGRFSAGWSLNRVLKVFLRFKSPVWLVEKSTSVWTRYHDTGRWTVKNAGPNHVIGELHDFAVRDDAFCARLRGWLHGAVEMTGGGQPRITEVQCAARGEGPCTFDLAWTGSSSA
jgi:hypothetical protein